ncbi:nucleoside hydrolase [Nocardia puris]|uniref:nucleoside hydrolase n=1 Tax=Nocardia puris TaxID=208602 RepID=UPI001894D19D|nr:nucleoside hydrolase [Nocardia puris]MBF6215860.1 nucleoside hydrolase [Nocardia puris]
MNPWAFRSTAVVVIVTDALYDLDDVIAIWIAARVVGRGRLVVVSADDPGGRRARVLRAFLDGLGREDARVVAGSELPGSPQRFVLPDDLVPDISSGAVESAVVDALVDLCEQAEPIVVGMAPLTDVARVLVARPDLAEAITLVQMGGWLDAYRDMSRASHNLRLDPAAAGLVLRMVPAPKLLLSTHTNDSRLRLTLDSPLVGWLTGPDSPTETAVVAANAAGWFARRPSSTVGDSSWRPGSWMADPLVLAWALGVPGVVESAAETIRVAADARMYRVPRGASVEVSTRIDLIAFHTWMSRCLPLGAHKIPDTATEFARGEVLR